MIVLLEHPIKNSGLLTVGAVNIDIPQHLVALHVMVTRGSKQLSSTLQELRVTRTASRLSRTGTVAGAPPPPDMDQMNSTGVPGSKAKFTVDLPQHSLSFTTKLQATEANLLVGSTCVRRVLDQDVPQTERVFQSAVQQQQASV
ncbi:tweek [Carabus blaptoides fortunei]